MTVKNFGPVEVDDGLLKAWTPTTEYVREAYVAAAGGESVLERVEARRSFDRWLERILTSSPATDRQLEL